ncbi:pleckstrin homology domain-containing family F member 2-like [Boleophthalmus pectinirostris]|uniref:pleckstrin homology domain-containing family F member 2-like n=1 Tax=Boleophthalmus pectinirostris TaxID=150288 RepID=UPI000A1C59A1|nr:pleckstrin homology domain-containing family F member 2-like [Boleophthalmus pectinirostris]
MAKTLTFDRENQDRIKAVADSFGPSGKPLTLPGRVLVGEGRLLKQSRKKPQPKVFFLFNDVIVYGSILVNGRWYKKQKIIPLENIKLEDMEDTANLKNQWLIQTPQKSFFVAAPTREEKRAWMEHIEQCKASLLQKGLTPTSEYAVSWMPDSASDICLVCEAKFTHTNRRHHCRMCGILVCHKCSKDKAVIGHISATKKQKLCRHCYSKKQEEVARIRGNSQEEDQADSSDEDDEVDVSMMYETPTSWLDTRMGTWGDIGQYMSMRPVSS